VSATLTSIGLGPDGLFNCNGGAQCLARLAWSNAMPSLPRLHWWVTVAAFASLLVVTLIAEASNREWIPRSVGGTLVLAWIPLMVLLVLASRVLGNFRLIRQPQGALIASIGGIVLGPLGSPMRPVRPRS